jgi:hypothetical protein
VQVKLLVLVLVLVLALVLEEPGAAEEAQGRTMPASEGRSIHPRNSGCSRSCCGSDEALRA